MKYFWFMCVRVEKHLIETPFDWCESYQTMQSIVCIKCVSSSYVEKTAADWLDGCKVSPLLSLERGAVLLGSFFSGESESVSKWKWKCLQPPLLSLERGAVLLRSFWKVKVKLKWSETNNFNDHSYFSPSMRCQFLWCLFLEACILGISFKVFVCRLNFMHTDWWRYLSDGTCRCRTGNKKSLESALISM